MANCECLAGCPFFNDKMADMPATAGIIKKRYCLGDSSRCARYMVFQTLGKGKVPASLSPSQVDVAHQVIAAG